jgi:primase-polymerase (primpol)-like protein
MKQIFNSDSHHNNIQKRELYIIKQLNHKLVTENAILVQVDKRKTTVIINSKEYSKKVQTFLTDTLLSTITTMLKTPETWPLI